MPSPFYRSGLNYTPAYQTSGKPFVTSSLTITGSTPTVVLLPQVSKFVSIRNEVATSSPTVTLRVGFSSQGVQGTNFIALENKETITRDWRVSQIWLYAPAGSIDASVDAGLTNIDSSELPFNWSGSVGV